MDEKMADSGSVLRDAETFITSKSWRVYLTVLVVAAAIYLGCIVSPPSLMDDSDAVLAQAARTMLVSRDWVTPRLDRVIYLEKPPLYYWPMMFSYMIFGVHDWSARIPVALSVIGLAWLTAAMGVWAFGRRAGLYAGLCMATCVGLFLFTRSPWQCGLFFVHSIPTSLVRAYGLFFSRLALESVC
jgi:4-amino-4-deoxy-L-arabinose transferase-like glycosyltransferase